MQGFTASMAGEQQEEAIMHWNQRMYDQLEQQIENRVRRDAKFRSGLVKLAARWERDGSTKLQRAAAELRTVLERYNGS